MVLNKKIEIFALTEIHFLPIFIVAKTFTMPNFTPIPKSYKDFILYSITLLFLCTSNALFASAKNTYELGSIASFPSEYSEVTYSTESTSSNNESTETTETSIEDEIDEITALVQKVKDEGRLLSKISSLNKVEYPIGITSSSEDLNYAIVLDSDYITKNGAFLTAYMSFEIPQNGKKLTFKAKDIPLSADGGIVGDAKLALVQDEDIDIGDNVTITIKGEDKSYVTFDCDGFKSFTIDAEISFSSDFFALEDTTTGKTIDGDMTTEFTATLYDWNDLIVEINIPAFQVKPLSGFGFEVKSAIFDFSDYANYAGQKFPDEYVSAYTDDALDILWQGIFIKEAIIRTPAELNGEDRLSLHAKNLIIDNTGFTGVLSANNILSLEQGSIGGWGFSIEKIEAKVVQNSITSSGLAGEIQLPIMDSALDYGAYIDQNGDFLFTASFPEDIDVSLWKANMKIDKSSTFTIEKSDDVYVPTVTLNGTISINSPIGSDASSNSSSSSKGFTVSGLSFEGLTLSTQDPYFKLGTWSLNEIGYSSDNLNGFSLTLKNIQTIENSSTENGIKFTACVSLMKEKYAASATLSVLGTMGYETSDGDVVRQKWKYKTTQVHSITLDVDAAISIKGSFTIYRDDDDFGNGVLGSVTVKFPAIDIGISATAQFGNIDGLKYWYVDAFVNLEKKPISLGSMSLYGLGGGAYHYMRQEAFDDVVLGSVDDESTTEASVGSSNSGIGYLPDQSTYLGLKATVVVGTAGNPEPFNADVTFEVTFSESMGIKTIALYGNGYLMSDLDIGKKNKTAPIYCNVYIGYDFDNDILHGNFKVYVNAAGGLIKGVNSGNLAGEMVVHYDPDDWYVHIGTTTERVGLKIDLGFIAIQNTSYFMIGTVVDPMPAPPDKVLEILDIEYESNRDLEDMYTGKGFAFGSEFSISTGDLQVLMFYASFDVGMGFDVNLGNYGDAYCVETGDKLGINGWYAQGQAYAFIEGAIGIRVNVFGAKINAEILSIGAATLLETKLPNPFWMSGTVGGYYSILGGKIKGNCSFGFEVGSQCTVQVVEEESSVVESLDVISELTPSNGETDVDVFNVPQAVFNYPINEAFEIPVDDDNVEVFRVILDEFDVTDENKNAISGTYEWNSTNDVVAFNSHDILPGQSKILLYAKVSFEQKIDGAWEKVTVNGETVTETSSYYFYTGDAPDYIPESNIEYCYPLIDQVNFYKDEYSKGYIQLKKGQAYLFETSDEWVQKGRFTSVASDNEIEFDYTYNTGKKCLNFDLPSGMSTNTVYQFDLVDKPANEAGSVDENITTSTTTTESDDGSTVEMEGNQAEGTVSILQEQYIYTAYFRTSRYSTFLQKINACSDWRSYSYNMYAGVDRIGKNFYTNELFESYETDTSDYSNPLIQCEASSNPWLSNSVIPLIYDDYPVTPEATITWRSTDILDVIPLKAIVNVQDDISETLTEDEKETGSVVSRSGRGAFVYYLAYYSYYDYFDMRDNLASGTGNTRINTMLSTTYPTIQLNTTYPIVIKYVLPGINEVTTTKTIGIEL